MKLDKLQNNAVTTNAKKVIVIAPAGSGKTRTIIERINHWIKLGVPTSEIAAITFTNIAAQEMRSRIIGDFEGYIGTIHSLASQVLDENGIKHSTWQAEKNKFNALLAEGMKYVKNRYNYVLVDEVQDIGNQEYDFIMSINAENYFFVGDDWQAIYQFKGGNLEIMKALGAKPEWEVHKLLLNYRSNSKICGIGYQIASNIKDKRDKYMTVANENDGKVYTAHINDVLKVIKQKKGYGDWMILARFNTDVDAILSLLKKNKIPCIGFKKSDLNFEKITEIMGEDTVKVLTIHSAKGLEAKNVVLYKGGKFYNDDEFRVLYVAATRAIENLFWCDKVPPCLGTYKDRYLNTITEDELLTF